MGWVTATLIEPITLQHFISTGFKGAGFKDFLPPTFKTSVYGLIIGSIACFTGMRAKGGAEGVGSAATTSVVLSIFVRNSGRRHPRQDHFDDLSITR